MIKNLENKIKLYLPLKIVGFEWETPLLNFWGKEWSFTTMSAWRILENENYKFGDSDKEISEYIKTLFAYEIKLIKITKYDPVFIFSNNNKLEIFSNTYFEPWVFSIKNEITYVGCPDSY